MLDGSIINRLTEAEITLRLRQALVETPTLATETTLRPAAVLIPLLREADRWMLLFTRRTETVQSHKGQVSFPGGGAEPGDASPVVTALREAEEEIGLHPADVRILGSMPEMVTNSNFLVRPVVGVIRWPNKFTLSVDEVGRVFTMPLDWLARSENWQERPRVNRLGQQENVIYFEPYDGEVLWGITARITVNFIRALLDGD